MSNFYLNVPPAKADKGPGSVRSGGNVPGLVRQLVIIGIVVAICVAAGIIWQVHWHEQNRAQVQIEYQQSLEAASDSKAE